jgi:hypothetical protein
LQLVVAELVMLLPVMVEHILEEMAAAMEVLAAQRFQAVALAVVVLVDILVMVAKALVLLMEHQLPVLAAAVAAVERLAEHLDGLGLAVVA